MPSASKKESVVKASRALSFVLLPLLVAASSPERAYWLVGTWSCESLAHTKTHMAFTREQDGMSMQNRYRTADGVSGEYDETYKYDSQASRWTWETTESSSGSKEEGTAGPWLTGKWTFDGTRRYENVPAQHIQMIYSRIDNASFRREFGISHAGAWMTTSSSVCKRTSS